MNVASATAALQPQDNLAESGARKNNAAAAHTTEQGNEIIRSFLNFHEMLE